MCTIKRSGQLQRKEVLVMEQKKLPFHSCRTYNITTSRSDTHAAAVGCTAVISVLFASCIARLQLKWYKYTTAAAFAYRVRPLKTRPNASMGNSELAMTF